MSDFDNYGKTCANCGGDYAIHHYQTNQCPVGGREAPEGRKQEWKTSTFREMPQPQPMAHQAEYDEMAARIAALEADWTVHSDTNKALQNRIGEAQKRIAALEAENARLRARLQDYADEHNFCLMCRNHPSSGHSEDCPFYEKLTK